MEPEKFIPPSDPRDLSTVPMAELREMRSALEEAEDGFSYARRLVQGRLDTVAAELDGRRGASPGDGVRAEELADVLAAHGRSSGSPRPTRSLAPPAWADALLEEVEEVLPPASLAHLDDVDLDTLGSIVDTITKVEAELSAARAGLHTRIDRIHDELVSRYRAGAEVEDLLTP